MLHGIRGNISSYPEKTSCLLLSSAGQRVGHLVPLCQCRLGLDCPKYKTPTFHPVSIMSMELKPASPLKQLGKIIGNISPCFHAQSYIHYEDSWSK